MLPDEPTTRLETYLARLAGQDVSIPDTPITRAECYLDYMIRNGGGVPAPNAGAHNATFRGKNLGSSYTEAQADAIDAGTFDDLFVGDYWEMPWGESQASVKFRIAGCDIYYQAGTPSLDKHHVVVIPDTEIGQSAYSDDLSVYDYISSYIRTTYLESVKTDLNTLFNNCLLTRYSLLPNSPTAKKWSASTVELPSISQVINMFLGNNWVGERSMVFPLFTLAPHLIPSTGYWFLEGNANANYIMAVSGILSTASPDLERNVRPYFCLGKVVAP